LQRVQDQQYMHELRVKSEDHLTQEKLSSIERLPHQRQPDPKFRQMPEQQGFRQSQLLQEHQLQQQQTLVMHQQQAATILQQAQKVSLYCYSNANFR
jgi:hypothetical protein